MGYGEGVVRWGEENVLIIRIRIIERPILPLKALRDKHDRTHAIFVQIETVIILANS